MRFCDRPVSMTWEDVWRCEAASIDCSSWASSERASGQLDGNVLDIGLRIGGHRRLGHLLALGGRHVVLQPEVGDRLIGCGDLGRRLLSLFGEVVGVA